MFCRYDNRFIYWQVQVQRSKRQRQSPSSIGSVRQLWFTNSRRILPYISVTYIWNYLGVAFIEINIWQTNLFRLGRTVIKLSSTIFVLIIPKSSNQNVVFIGYDVLIGCFSSRSTKLVLESFMTVRPAKSFLIWWWYQNAVFIKYDDLIGFYWVQVQNLYSKVLWPAISFQIL
jgi:hypothetical protein